MCYLKVFGFSENLANSEVVVCCRPVKSTTLKL